VYIVYDNDIHYRCVCKSSSSYSETLRKINECK